MEDLLQLQKRLDGMAGKLSELKKAPSARLSVPSLGAGPSSGDVVRRLGGEGPDYAEQMAFRMLLTKLFATKRVRLLRNCIATFVLVVLLQIERAACELKKPGCKTVNMAAVQYRTSNSKSSRPE